MQLADSNIWVALALSKHVFHSLARQWLDKQLPTDAVVFCRATQQSLLRLLTTAAVLAPYGIPPLTNEAAWSQYEAFLADERVTWVEEPKGLERHWKQLTDVPRASPKVWMDAYLAAFATAGKYQFVTTDAAFRQFKGLDLLVLSSS